MPHTTHEVMRRQAGVISRDQALACGLSERQIDYRLQSGLWTAMFPGVYLSADAEPTWSARAHASVLACGQDAVVVGESGAAVRQLVPKRLPVHVAIARRSRRRLAGPRLVVHRLDVAADERVVVDGLLTTNRLRTAVDLAHLLPITSAQPLLDRMLVLDHVDLDELTAVIERSRRWGSAKARQLMRSAQDATAAESERIVRRLLRDAGIGGWISNDPFATGGSSGKLDLVNHKLRIVIEVKGWIFHSRSDRAASDDNRVIDLQLASWIAIPVGWLTLMTEPEAFIARVQAAVEFRRRESAA